MLREFSPPRIPEIMQAASAAIKAHVLERIAGVANFPTTQLGGEDGHLIDVKGVVVDYGVPVPNEGLVYLAERDAVVLLPDGLFVGTPVETRAKDDSYFTSVPNLRHLGPAPLTTYLKYGKRALTLLDQTVRAQLHH